MWRAFLLGLLLLAVTPVAAAWLHQPPTRPVAPPLPTASTLGTVRGPDDSMTINLDEAALTAQLQQILAGRSLGETPLGSATARDLRVKVRESGVQASGTAQAGLASLPVQLDFSLATQNGRLTVVTTEATLGGMALPDGARQQIDRAIQKPVDEIFAGQGLAVRSATAGSGVLSIVLARR